jgi:hypothetical protein
VARPGRAALGCEPIRSPGELHRASSLTDIYYISRRLVGREKARAIVRSCLDRLTVLPVDRALLEDAFGLAAPDFEDALQIALAQRGSLDAIVTRNVADYAASEIPVFSPADFAHRLKLSGSEPSA